MTHDEVSAKRVRRVVLSVAVVLLACCMIYVGALVVDRLTTQVSAEEKQQLPDGSTVALRTVLGGTDVHFTTKRFTHRLLEMLPTSLARRLAPNASYYEEKVHGPNVVVLFFQRTVPASGSATSLYQVTVSDGHAWGSEHSSSYYTYPKTGSGDPLLYYVFSVPPTAQDLIVQFKSPNSVPDSSSVLASFKVKNPLYNPNPPKFSGGMLPLSASDRMLSATLLKCVSGVDEKWSWDARRKLGVNSVLLARPPRGKPDQSVTFFAFQLAENDQVTTAWKVNTFHARDALGSDLRENTSWNDPGNELLLYQATPALWTGAGAFAMEMEFLRTDNYPEDELWTVTVDVPTTSTFVKDGRSSGTGMRQLTLLGVGGENTNSPNHGCTSGGMLLDFLVPESTTDTRRLEIVSATDNLGRKLARGMLCGGGFGNYPGKVVQSYTVEWLQAGKQLPDRGSSVTLCVAFTKAHKLTFTVEPEAAK
jgi:hypothetical protein